MRSAGGPSLPCAVAHASSLPRKHPGRNRVAGQYPTGEVLEELDPVTIAGVRLDLQLAFLLHSIDPAVELLGRVRPLSGSELTRRVRMRAELHLDEPLHGIVLTLADDVDAVRRERNELVHGEWLLRGSDATRPAAEVIAAVDGTDPADAEAYVRAWEREAKASPEWQRLLARSLELEPPPTLDELVAVEHRLGAVAVRVVEVTYAVASSRDTGTPPGYRRPSGR